MKTNVTLIIKAHLATLYDVRTGRLGVADIVEFLLLPLSVGGVALIADLKLPSDFYSVTITFFGIFIALLLNIQVALFAILQRKWSMTADERSNQIAREHIVKRSELLGQLNSNISYLIVVCIFSLVCALIALVAKATENPYAAVADMIYVHFVMTLLMIVKRSYALFQREYSESS